MAITPPLAPHREPPVRPGFPDPLAWLENKQEVATQDHIAAERHYYHQITQSQQKTVDVLYNEIKERMQLEDSSHPYQIDNYKYYERTLADSEYSIHCRQKCGSDCAEEILLDENELAQGYAFFAIGSVAVSPDHNYLAFTCDTQGDEHYVLMIKDLRQNRLLSTRLRNTAPNIAWSATNDSLYYLTLNRESRPYRCYQHRLGSLPHQDTLLFTEWDERYFLDVSLGKSEEYVFLSAESKLTTEVYYLPAHDTNSDFVSLKPRQENVRYYVDHHKERFYILSNETGLTFALWSTMTQYPDRVHWECRLPARADITLEELELMQDYFVITERHQALLKFRILSYTPQEPERALTFPEPIYQVSGEDNFAKHSNVFRYHYESLTTPVSVYEVNLDDLQQTLLKQDQVLGDFDLAKLTSQRIFAIAPDGTQIPISLVHHQDFPPAPQRPLYLYGYGAYGCSLDAWFSYSRLSLLERGITFAIAHIRGGGDCGEQWHEGGKLQHKENTFADFACCAQHLCDHNYTSAAKLIISGGSAGGLLIGAVLNRYPGLCALAVADVPFVDVLNTMLNDSLPLTVTEYEEWGNPNEIEAYQRIASYSPYENVKEQAYPDMYVTCGLHDVRVPYWEALKWSQAIRRCATNHPVVAVYMNEEAGHSGASGRFNALREIAQEYAFLFAQLE